VNVFEVAFLSLYLMVGAVAAIIGGNLFDLPGAVGGFVLGIFGAIVFHRLVARLIWGKKWESPIVLPNKSLERTVSHRGRTVRALAVCARAGAEMRLWPAVQRNR
jgi:uncharacterized membrane protein YeaQ/YmgE (transglycosylase-associated protein family)